MSDSAGILKGIAARKPLRGRRLLVIGVSEEAMDFCASAMSCHGMQAETIDGSAWRNFHPASELACYDIVYVADDTVSVGAHFLNHMNSEAWLVLERSAFDSHDRNAINHALWFETIGGVSLLEPSAVFGAYRVGATSELRQ